MRISGSMEGEGVMIYAPVMPISQIINTAFFGDRLIQSITQLLEVCYSRVGCNYHREMIRVMYRLFLPASFCFCILYIQIAILVICCG